MGSLNPHGFLDPILILALAGADLPTLAPRRAEADLMGL